MIFAILFYKIELMVHKRVFSLMQVFRHAFLCFLLYWNVFSDPVLKLNIPAHRLAVTRLGVSSQTGMILSGSPDGTVCLWDSIGNHVESFFPPLFAHGKMLYSCTISPDGLIGAVALSGPKPEVAWSTWNSLLSQGKSLWRTELRSGM
jgi:WD40 repeat protein